MLPTSRGAMIRAHARLAETQNLPTLATVHHQASGVPRSVESVLEHLAGNKGAEERKIGLKSRRVNVLGLEACRGRSFSAGEERKIRRRRHQKKKKKKKKKKEEEESYRLTTLLCLYDLLAYLHLNKPIPIVVSQ